MFEGRWGDETLPKGIAAHLGWHLRQVHVIYDTYNPFMQLSVVQGHKKNAYYHFTCGRPWKLKAAYVTNYGWRTFFGNQTPKTTSQFVRKKLVYVWRLTKRSFWGGGGKNVEGQSLLGQWTSRDPEQARYIHTGNFKGIHLWTYCTYLLS